MAESSQLSDRPLKDPVRIVYHTEKRTFARLFNEHSLGEVKDVVRRKLGLGRETDVSLKQMRPDALLDLEDDDDFEAFRVLLKSCVSAEIQVTVGSSRGTPVSPPVAPQPRVQPSATELPTTSSTVPPEEPAASEAVSQPSAPPEVASTSKRSTATKKTRETSARKRKVSFGGASVVVSDKPAERPVPSKAVVETPVSSERTAEVAEPSVTPKSGGGEEPPKKKQRKESVKPKIVQLSEGVESPLTEASGAPKSKARKPTALTLRGGKGKSVPRDDEPSELPAAKPKKKKKDDSTDPKKSSAPNPDGTDQPISQSSNPVNVVPPEPEGPIKSGAKGSRSKTSQLEKPIGVCATIAQTSASNMVQSEVAAAILSSALTTTPAPPAKRKSVNKDTKKSSASSSRLLAHSTSVSHTPATGVPSVPAEQDPGLAVPTNEPLQQPSRESGSPSCPICLGEPFHIRYRCPTVIKGPGAIRERLEEVKRTNVAGQQSLIKELEGLLRDAEVIPPHNASAPRTPNIPSNSHLSEVAVESRDEGSSSESSDDMAEGRIENNKELPAPRKQKMPDKQPSPFDNLEAVMRGPVSKRQSRQSILHVLDRIVRDEEDKDSDPTEEEGEVVFEDPEEEIGRSSNRLSKHTMRSSDSEQSFDSESGSEEVGSRSSSPSGPAEDSLEPSVQGSSNPVKQSTELHPGVDVVMKDCVDPPVRGGQDDDSSEETHVGSEDRMVVDDPSREKDSVSIVEEQLSLPAPIASCQQPSDAPSHEPQESRQTDVNPASNRDGGGLVTSEVPNQAEMDPIEPADGLELPTTSSTDPIEAPPEETRSLFTGVPQSTPKPGVTKRIKTRNGQIPDDEAEHPVLLEQLTSETTEGVNPLPAKGKPRRKVAEMSSSQEPATTRKSARISSLPPPASTPAAVALLNHKARLGARSGKAAKTPAKQSAHGSQSSAKDGDAQNGVRLGSTWETLAEPPSSPSQQPDEPDDNPVCDLLPRTPAPSNGVEGSKGKGRLFDLSSSQIPFPYSQHKNNPTQTAFSNGNGGDASTDSEEEAKATKKQTRLPVRYRSLSQLAAQASLFSPSLPTPANKSIIGGKTKKRVADKDSSSSSSSSDEDEAGGSEHIPRGRRAGSVLETKKKKGLLSRI